MKRTDQPNPFLHPVQRFLVINWWRRGSILFAGLLCVPGCILLIDGLLGLKGDQLDAVLGNTLLGNIVGLVAVVLTGSWLGLILEWVLSSSKTGQTRQVRGQQLKAFSAPKRALKAFC